MGLLPRRVDVAAGRKQPVGRLFVEFDETPRIFTNPRESKTEDYVTGKFG